MKKNSIQQPISFNDFAKKTSPKKPLTPGQIFLLASSGVPKKERDTMSTADIAENEHLYKSIGDTLTPLQVQFFEANNIDYTGATYRAARKAIISYLQANDFDEILSEYMTNNWKQKKTFPSLFTDEIF